VVDVIQLISGIWRKNDMITENLSQSCSACGKIMKNNLNFEGENK